MAEGLSVRMLMEHRDAQGVSLFTSWAWRRLFDIRGPLVNKLIMEFFSTFRFGEAVTNLDLARALQFQLGRDRRRLSWRQFILALGFHTAEEMKTVGFTGDFLGIAPSYTSIRDPILRLCHRLIAYSIDGRSQAPAKVAITDLFYLRGMDVGSVNISYLLTRYLRLFATGRKRKDLISRGQFVARLAEHFGLMMERPWGLTIIALALLVIDMAKQPNAAVGVPGAVEDATAVDEGDQAFLTPVQAPQHPPPPPPAAGRTMPQRLGSWRLASRHFRHSMGPFGGAHLQHSKDAPGKGLARPSPPQPNRTSSS
ncbi:hypothetical protein Tco_1367129 [Tanacetum coccineum]